MEALRAPLLANEEYKAIVRDIEAHKLPIAITGLTDSAQCYLMDEIGQKSKYRLIVTHSDQRAKELYDAYRFFDREVVIYPAKDVLFYSADIHGNAIVRKRMEILRRIVEKEPTTIIVTIDALLDRLPDISYLEKNIEILKVGATIDSDKLCERFIEFGYEKSAWVDGIGQFAVRGGIIDIYPLTEECPYRIELWGEEIDSIRSFDVESQRSIEEVNTLTVYPATEMVLSQNRIARGIREIEEECTCYSEKLRKQMRTEEAARVRKTIAALKEELTQFHAAIGLDSYVHFFYTNLVSFLDYLPKDSMLYIDDANRVLERANAYQLEFRESMMSRLEGGYILPSQADVLFDYEAIFAQLAMQRTILFQTLWKNSRAFEIKEQYEFESRTVQSYNNHLEELVKSIQAWKNKDYAIILCCPSETRAKRIADELFDYEINCFWSEDASRVLAPREMLVTTGRLARGFELPELHLVVISESDIFPTSENQRKKKRIPRYTGEKIKSFADIAVGDYVVHEHHGVGIYRGIEKIEVDKVIKDYISIEYRGGSKLFILASQLDLIQKYASQESRKPKLNKLGGTEWTTTKNRVKGQVADIAKDLVDLYAVRQSKEGYAYSEDNIWQKEFEELFPYEETNDQMKAIDDTKKDMESHKIMDRLICGDVGYGKTEVAIRAAFKAVQDGKQVVYLVPTTILAQQHFSTFQERMKDYPISVKMLSRFCTTTEQRKTMDGLKKGSVDIVIGTHRLLSKDIEYKNLGLLVIDEEQRFGVTHKEKIKQMKKDVDVLTLTATPIPRTLHMSLIGIRDMSVLEEPPVDRRAIQTYVLEYNKELVKEAILRELARGGQVYYVYNRVNNIEQITFELQEMLPEVRVSFAHGQMKERELENIMYSFMNGDIDVLVTTTIIETGLDISNVNTMIIHDAENFGLSQLYQLRGRVGRSNRGAYAFLMYRRDKLLKETAEKRLQAIREFTDLGSGFKIAMRDLEIRGAGNLLGSDQSGHMEAVGYDLYCKMLNDAIRRQKGETIEEDFETVIELPMDAYIPASYVKNEYTKLELYKRIAQIQTQEDCEDLQDEMTDRFGEIPTPPMNLLQIALLKAKAHTAWIAAISLKGKELQFEMNPQAAVLTDKIDSFMKEYQGKMRIEATKVPTFILRVGVMPKKELLNCVESVINAILLLIDIQK